MFNTTLNSICMTNDFLYSLAICSLRFGLHLFYTLANPPFLDWFPRWVISRSLLSFSFIVKNTHSISERCHRFGYCFDLWFLDWSRTSESVIFIAHLRCCEWKFLGEMAGNNFLFLPTLSLNTKGVWAFKSSKKNFIKIIGTLLPRIYKKRGICKNSTKD